jgi:hypothetical protein
MEEKKDGAQDAGPEREAAISAELSRMRSRNKILKSATILLSGLFILIVCAAIFIYKKVSDLKDLVMPQTETFQDSAFRVEDNGLSGAPPKVLPDTFGGAVSSTQVSGGSALTVFTNAGEYSQGGGEGIGPEDGERAARVASKYADRPIVKDFMAELRKDPDFVQALRAKDANNPMAMIASIQHMKSMQTLMTKFMMRRDFIPFMAEVMNDPDMKPMLGKLPVGNMGGMMQMLKTMRDPEQSPVPPPTVDEPGTFLDPSAKRTRPVAKALKKKVPPPPAD